MEHAIDDTTPRARALLVERWRAMSSAEKLRVASEHSTALERLSILGLGLRYPAASAEELRQRAAALRVGRDLFARCTGREFEW